MNYRNPNSPDATLEVPRARGGRGLCLDSVRSRSGVQQVGAIGSRSPRLDISSAGVAVRVSANPGHSYPHRGANRVNDATADHSAWEEVRSCGLLRPHESEHRAQVPQTIAQQEGGAHRWNSVQICTTDGTCLSGLLGYPQQSKRTALQAVVLVHGFAAERTEKGLFTEIGDLLLRSGYIVLAYDWRGLGESEGDFSRTSLSTHTSDFQCVVRRLRHICGLASTQCCAVGFSLGAALVVRAIQNGLRLGASSFWSPAVRPCLSMWPRYNTPELRRELKTKGFILKPETKVRLGAPILHSLRKTDLGLNAFALGLPLLVCHGTDDSRIPIEHSRQVFSCSEHEGVIFAEFAGASHSFRPAQEQRSSLFRLFTHWLSDESFRAQRGQLRMTQDWQPSLEAVPSEHQTVQAVGV